MLAVLCFLASLGLTSAGLYMDDTSCVTNYGGVCHSISNGCPSGFSHYTYSACSFLNMCCYNRIPDSGHVSATTTKAPSNGSCGIRAYNYNHRIIGGTHADIKQYPWQVSLQYLYYHLCGGTLIDNQHVLTAAHCFQKHKNAADWDVIVGVSDISSVSYAHTHRVSKIFLHSLYDKTTHTNDIAILRLSKPVDLSGPSARHICLPEKGAKYDNRLCTVTGWGDIASGQGSGVDLLRQVDLPIITNDLCAYYMNDVSRRKVTDKQICAGFEEGGKDACQGDSGGPLVCLEDDGVTWKIAGVVSWGYGCALYRSPGIYTRVSEYLDWIDTAVNMP